MHPILTVRTNPTSFVFGGQDTIAKSTAEDLYVLTLPGFVWTKLDNPQGGARTDHVCVVAGKRQMVTVGGIKRLGGGDSFRLADPFPQGLGVFDMTELSWGTDFKADAAEYESPQIVQDWYDKNGYVCDLPRDGAGRDNRSNKGSWFVRLLTSFFQGSRVGGMVVRRGQGTLYVGEVQ